MKESVEAALSFDPSVRGRKSPKAFTWGGKT
jgi:hypothetical protein